MVRIGGACGVLFLVVLVVSFVLVSVTGVVEEDLYDGAVESYLPELAEDKVLLLTSLWLANVSWALLVAYGVGLYQVLRSFWPGVRLGLLAMAGGAFAYFMADLVIIGVAEGLAPTFDTASGGDRAILGTVAQTFVDISNGAAVLGGVLLAAAALLFGVAVLRTTALPRWPASLALAAGILGILGGFTPLDFFFSLFSGSGLLLLALWAAATGVTMLRARAAEAE